MSSEPLDTLLAKMRAGDVQAAEQVFLAHEPLLRLIVRRKLSPRLRAKFDSVDVVQSVWVHVWDDLRAAGDRIANAAHLRNFLAQATRHRLIDRVRHLRNALATEEPLLPVHVAAAPAMPWPRPSEEAQANELWDKMLALCPPEHHDLLRLRRQGIPLSGLAARTGLHEGSIRRIFRQLARKLAVPVDQMAS